MAHTDIAEVRDTVKENASAAVDTVRGQAAAAGESVGAAVSAALDTALDTAVGARKKADKTARAAGGKLQEQAEKLQEQAVELSVAVQEKVADAKASHRGRTIVLLGIVAATGVAVAVLVSRKRSESVATVPPEGSAP